MPFDVGLQVFAKGLTLLQGVLSHTGAGRTLRETLSVEKDDLRSLAIAAKAQSNERACLRFRFLGDFRYIPYNRDRREARMQPQDVTRVLSDPLAQELMQSSIPARLAYLGPDGFPRAIPIGFHWNGIHFVLCTVPHAPKVSALKTNPKVAFTVDTNAFPPHVLLVRGTAAIEIVDGVPPEYLAASRKGVGPDQWDAFEAQVRAMYKQMARIKITPLWAKLLDFQTRFPTPIEKLIRRAG